MTTIGGEYNQSFTGETAAQKAQRLATALEDIERVA
jgi:hypothetical protein